MACPKCGYKEWRLVLLRYFTLWLGRQSSQAKRKLYAID